MTEESAAAAEAAAAHGQPATQWEAEHPPAEVTEREARDYEARMPGTEAVAGDPAAEQATGRERGGPAVAAETISTEPRRADRVVDVNDPEGSTGAPYTGNLAGDQPPEQERGDVAAEHGTSEPATEGDPAHNPQEQ